MGGLLFLLPFAGLLAWLSWPLVVESLRVNEMSSDAGGLVRWPAKLLLPLGLGLLFLQGLSEVIKSIGILRGLWPPTEETPVEEV